MRYVIDFDKVVNKLVPHYIGGRKLILYLQALLKPLQQLNDSFYQYSIEKRIEASMTSQVLKLEWYLNRQMYKYFKYGGQISISNSQHLGVPIYYGNASIDKSKHMLLYKESEHKGDVSLYYPSEKTARERVSFIVYSPEVATEFISKEAYEAMLKSYIDRYRIAGKTYIIKYNDNERI